MRFCRGLHLTRCFFNKSGQKCEPANHFFWPVARKLLGSPLPSIVFSPDRTYFFQLTCCKFSVKSLGISASAVSSPISSMLNRFGMYAKFLMWYRISSCSFFLCAIAIPPDCNFNRNVPGAFDFRPAFTSCRSLYRGTASRPLFAICLPPVCCKAANPAMV